MNHSFFAQGSNKLSQKLLLSLNESGLIHMVPSMVNDLYIIRFAVCAKHATDEDMQIAYRIIQDHATIILAEYKAQRNGRRSSSNDSLESHKTAVTNENTHDRVASEEKLDSEVPVDNMNNRHSYPTTKIRVQKTILLNFTDEKLIYCRCLFSFSSRIQ